MLNPEQMDIGRIYKTEASRVLSGLIKILGDLDLAEEALQDAFSVAIEKWPQQGIPQNPYAWLISTGKFKAIDRIRRSTRGNQLVTEKYLTDSPSHTLSLDETTSWEKHQIEDNQLRLIFYCCHPDLPLDSRIALSLREVCGMSTTAIARAYLLPPDTLKKRITRAKQLIKKNNIAFEIPDQAHLKQRVDAVLHVIYLIYNEGYSTSSGTQHVRPELTEEAIFLSRQVVKLIATPESLGLLALLLLHESRRNARVNNDGDLIPLEEQDRSTWDKSLIHEGMQLLQQVIMSGQLGPYSLQAAISSVHAQADSVKNTRWDLIIGYYDMLVSIQASPVVRLNRAIAVGMHKGAEVGLAQIESLITEGSLKNYHFIYAAQAEFYKILGNQCAARKAYLQAIELTQQEPERRYLERQLVLIN